ncbi:MAG: cytochrome D1 domain-containing protein [Gemmatimonadota bacterium]
MIHSNRTLFALALIATATLPARSAGAQTGGQAGTLVVTNMGDNTATVIDLKSGKVRATLPTGVGPHEVAASSDGRWAVVTNYGVRGKPGSTLTVIDLRSATVSRTIDLGAYQRPHGIAFYPGDSMLVVTSEANKVVLLVKFGSGQVVATVPTERPVSHMLALAKAGDRLFTTNISDGSITGINPRTRQTMAVIPVARQVEGIAVTPDGKRVWVGSNGDSIVVVIDADKGQPVDTLTGFGMPYRLAITSTGKVAVISDPIKAQVRVIDADTRKLIHLVQIPAEQVLATAEFAGSPCPEGITVSHDGKWAYVTLQGRNQVAAIDLTSGAIAGYTPVGASPDGIAFAPPSR